MSVEKKTAGNEILETFAALYYISYAKFSQILKVLRDFHRLSGSRNSPTTSILHTIRHVYRSVWPAREAEPRFGAALERSAHDFVTRLLHYKRNVTSNYRVFVARYIVAKQCGFPLWTMIQAFGKWTGT